jgi:Ribbon-helix-helix protein, copG family
MPLVLSLEEILDVERLALARIERADTLVDLGSQLAQLLDVRQQPLADLLLIGIRQGGDFRDCLFEHLDHVSFHIIFPGKHANLAHYVYAMAITIHLPAELEAHLRRRADAQGAGLSEFVREAIAEKLSREATGQPSDCELGASVFGGYGSGRNDLSTDRKAILDELLRAKHSR